MLPRVAVTKGFAYGLALASNFWKLASVWHD